MLRHSLEGQATEIGWIRDNVCELDDDDYLRMCLKKTSWYTCIYPCRIGALVATGEARAGHDFDRFGWYLGAAFQIQDDILNLVGDFEQYGKEISGDLWEGKRTLMLIRFLQSCTGDERESVRGHLARARRERDPEQVLWMRDRLTATECLEPVRHCARELAEAARVEGSQALAEARDSDDKRFLLELPAYVIGRDR